MSLKKHLIPEDNPSDEPNQSPLYCDYPDPSPYQSNDLPLEDLTPDYAADNVTNYDSNSVSPSAPTNTATTTTAAASADVKPSDSKSSSFDPLSCCFFKIFKHWYLTVGFVIITFFTIYMTLTFFIPYSRYCTSKHTKTVIDIPVYVPLLHWFLWLSAVLLGVSFLVLGITHLIHEITYVTIIIFASVLFAAMWITNGAVGIRSSTKPPAIR